MVSAADGEQIEVPRFRHRLTALSRQVYDLNVQMLRLLKDGLLGHAAPRELASAVGNQPGTPLLEIGDQGQAVRRLQRALRRTGEDLIIDGLFGRQTWLAVRSAQQARGINVDGITGPRTWAVLPSGEPMPVLRLGSTGPAVTALQRILTNDARDRWETAPDAVSGIFDDSTSAAVQAFQRWNAIHIDGQVGDQTWATTVGAGRVSLENAVGLEHITASSASA